MAELKFPTDTAAPTCLLWPGITMATGPSGPAPSHRAFPAPTQPRGSPKDHGSRHHSPRVSKGPLFLPSSGLGFSRGNQRYLPPLSLQEVAMKTKSACLVYNRMNPGVCGMVFTIISKASRGFGRGRSLGSSTPGRGRRRPP